MSITTKFASRQPRSRDNTHLLVKGRGGGSAGGEEAILQARPPLQAGPRTLQALLCFLRALPFSSSPDELIKATTRQFLSQDVKQLA